MPIRALRIRVNGKYLDKPELPALVYPGSGNLLALETAAPVPAGTCVRLQAVTPDGRTREQTAGLSKETPAEFDLGPLAAPAAYEYEAGVVYRRGYRFRLSVGPTGGAPVAHFGLYQGLTRDKDAESLFLGHQERVRYNDGYIPEGEYWKPHEFSGRPMSPPLDFRLAPHVLADQDRVEVCYRTRADSPELGNLKAVLVVRDESGIEMRPRQKLEATAEWQTVPLDLTDWPPGRYPIELWPEVGGKVYEEGPLLIYRRREADADTVQVSALAPFAMRLDRSRALIENVDWNSASIPEGWSVEEAGGELSLVSRGDPSLSPVTLDPNLNGHYAVFAEAINIAYLRVRLPDGAQDAVVRRIDPPERPEWGAVFVTVADLGGARLEIYSGGSAGCGLRQLRLVPVTRDSAEAFLQVTQNPPCPLRGVDDWWCYFSFKDVAHRVEEDQFDTIIRGQREVGISSLDWAVGRSWVQYPSKLADAKLFPCVPITDEMDKERPDLRAWERMVGDFDALGYPLSRREAHDMRMLGWLAMNRHYNPESYGGTFTSPWARAHLEFRMGRKGTAEPESSRMEYFFPEVRKERIDILAEVAAYGPDGIVFGCCRQPPMAGYNPAMVAEYKKLTGVDPNQIDLSHGEPFVNWLKWRSGHVTQCVRELRKRLSEVEAELGRPVPVVARVPSEDLFHNLALGLDVQTWIEEGLIDELQLDPLETSGGGASHDVRPCLDLCRKHGVPCFGGVNGTTGTRDLHGSPWSPVAGIRRAIGLVRAGVDGIEVYEAEILAWCDHRRWLVSLWGNADLAERFLDESNLDAVFPVDAFTAANGHDNHWHPPYSLYGVDELPRGMKCFV